MMTEWLENGEVTLLLPGLILMYEKKAFRPRRRARSAVLSVLSRFLPFIIQQMARTVYSEVLLVKNVQEHVKVVHDTLHHFKNLNSTRRPTFSHLESDDEYMLVPVGNMNPGLCPLGQHNERCFPSFPKCMLH